MDQETSHAPPPRATSSTSVLEVVSVFNAEIFSYLVEKTFGRAFTSVNVWLFTLCKRSFEKARRGRGMFILWKSIVGRVAWRVVRVGAQQTACFRNVPY